MVPRIVVPAGSADGLHELAAGRRTGQGERAHRRQPSIAVADHGREFARTTLTPDLDNRDPVRCHRDPGLLLGGLFGLVAGEHELFGRVLLIDHQVEVPGPTVDGDQPGEVVVEAELLLLGVGGLIVEVEGGGAGQHRIAPSDDHGLFVARWDHQGVFGIRCDRDEVHPGGAGPGRSADTGSGGTAARGCRGGVVTTGGQGRGGADRHHCGRRAAQDRTP